MHLGILINHEEDSSKGEDNISIEREKNCSLGLEKWTTHRWRRKWFAIQFSTTDGLIHMYKQPARGKHHNKVEMQEGTRGGTLCAEWGVLCIR